MNVLLVRKTHRVHVQANIPDFKYCDDDFNRMKWIERHYSFVSSSWAEDADACEQLIEEAVAASTTDMPQQHIGNTLLDDAPNTEAFWSSSGSESDCEEWLLYRLKYPVCQLQFVKIAPYRAYFQRGEPLYPPVAVSFEVGGSPDTLQPVSSQYLVQLSERVQVFAVPPTACTGRYLKVCLHNKQQKQLEDMRYYTAIRFVAAFGQPVAPDAALSQWRGWHSHNPTTNPTCLANCCQQCCKSQPSLLADKQQSSVSRCLRRDAQAGVSSGWRDGSDDSSGRDVMEEDTQASASTGDMVYYTPYLGSLRERLKRQLTSSRHPRPSGSSTSSTNGPPSSLGILPPPLPAAAQHHSMWRRVVEHIFANSQQWQPAPAPVAPPLMQHSLPERRPPPVQEWQQPHGTQGTPASSWDIKRLVLEARTGGYDPYQLIQRLQQLIHERRPLLQYPQALRKSPPPVPIRHLDNSTSSPPSMAMPQLFHQQPLGPAWEVTPCEDERGWGEEGDEGQEEGMDGVE